MNPEIEEPQFLVRFQAMYDPSFYLSSADITSMCVISSTTYSRYSNGGQRSVSVGITEAMNGQVLTKREYTPRSVTTQYVIESLVGPEAPLQGQEHSRCRRDSF